MTVPTIVSVTPSSGYTVGQNVVRIAGTGFRLPNPPSLTGPIMADQQKTVSVKFQGVESEWAYSASATLILARVPTWTGAYDVTFPLALNVRVANLDDAGVEIPGENATRTNAYSINRPGLATESYLQRVIRETIVLFRRHILKNTHYTTSRDFTLTPAQQETLRAEGPLVQLTGPRLLLNRFDSLNREEPEADPLGGSSGMMRRKPPVTVDVEFTVALWANNPEHIHSLVQAYLLFHRDIKHVKVAVNPADLTQGTKDYEFDLAWSGYPGLNTDPTAEDLMYATAQSVIRGVHIDEDSGTIIERGWIVTQNNGEPVLQVQ